MINSYINQEGLILEQRKECDVYSISDNLQAFKFDFKLESIDLLETCNVMKNGNAFRNIG